MKEHYCFWTIAPDEAAVEAACKTVASARAVGMFKEFHVWTEAQAIEGATCHGLGQWNPWGGLYRFTYLRDAVSTLPFEHYVWLNPGTEFLRHPGSVLRALRRAPVHVPLGFDLADPGVALDMWGGAPCGELARCNREAGVLGRLALAAYSGFFIVHRDVIGTFHRLAFDFWHRCQATGLSLSCEPLLAYAAQMLTGDPRRHHLSHLPELWVPKELAETDSGKHAALVGG